MIILSLIFLAFIGINIISSSIKAKIIDEYMNDIEKDLLQDDSQNYTNHDQSLLLIERKKSL